MVKKITIIGGGISGLYTALKLVTSKVDIKITIIEKNNYIGGRIFTHRERIEKQRVHFDCGAGRLGSRSAQPLLWNLLDLLNLTEKTVGIPTTQDLHFQELIEKLQQFSDEQLMNSTISQLIGNVDPSIFGYDAEFKCMNAKYAKDYIQRHFLGEHFYINGGMDQIVKKLMDKLMKQRGIIIRTNSCVFELNQTYCRLRDGTLIEHDHVYVTIPPRQYLQLRFPSVLKDVIYNMNASVEPVSLCRLFVGIRNFKNCTSPFGNVGRLTHAGPIRMFFTMHTYPTFTVCQIYTDSLWAKWWNEQIYSKRLGVMTSELQKLFPDVKQKFVCMYYKNAFWRNGVHVWKPTWTNTSVNQRPFPWISACGESMSKTSQGWIEGSLESVESMFLESSEM